MSSVFDVERKNRRTITVLATILVLGIVGCLIGGGIYLYNQNKHKNTPDPSSSVSATATRDVKRKKQFWEREGNEYPVSLEDWQKRPATDLDKAKDSKGNDVPQEVRDANRREVSDFNLVIPGASAALQSLPSRSTGFTDDSSKAFLEDGRINPSYSYWTAEGFNENVFGVLQMMVNPEFGGWKSYQFPYGADMANRFDGMAQLFTPFYDQGFLDSVKDKPVRDWLPVFADYDGNNYGMADQLLPDGTRWVGVVDRVQVEFKYDEASLTYSAHVVADVSYHAWGKDESKLEKKGVISFDVVAGDETAHYKLSNSKLEMA